jgi:hypothetical protein
MSWLKPRAARTASEYCGDRLAAAVDAAVEQGLDVVGGPELLGRVAAGRAGGQAVIKAMAGLMQLTKQGQDGSPVA